MPRKAHKYYYLYKTTNNINGKYYIGMHSTSNLEDGYLGSGKRLKYSINKYGKENFSTEIIKFFDSREELIKGEKEIVNEILINDTLCMNLMIGGSGGNAGYSSEQYRIWASLGANKTWEKFQNNEILYNNFLQCHSNRFKILWQEGKLKFYDWTGKKHKEETKEKMSEKAKLRIGEKNNMFGTCWITKENTNKKIKKDELENYISLGWIKGRKV